MADITRNDEVFCLSGRSLPQLVVSESSGHLDDEGET